eukprot:518291-Prorocentrum_minimum.AAC.2
MCSLNSTTLREGSHTASARARHRRMASGSSWRALEYLRQRIFLFAAAARNIKLLLLSSHVPLADTRAYRLVAPAREFSGKIATSPPASPLGLNTEARRP